jgi:hypothetical protein
MNTSEPLTVNAHFICKSWTPPSNQLGDDAITTGANVRASKLEHQYRVRYSQRPGADVVTQTEDVHVVGGLTGTLEGVDVAPITAPTGGDKKFTVDIQKGNQSTGFTTMLTAVVTIDNTIVNRQVVAGSIVGGNTLADGDILRVIVTASGSTGSQAQAVVVVLKIREKAD